MVLHFLRGLFILLMAAIGWRYLQLGWLTMAVAVTIALLFVALDIVSPRRKLTVFSGVLFGLLVGIVVSYALSFVVRLVVDQAYFDRTPADYSTQTAVQMLQAKQNITEFIQLTVGIVTCYLTVSFVLQTKDDFRFIVPYVEFKKSEKGSRPFILDTSVLIDGRIVEIAETGLIESQLVVPQFVLQELQEIADSGDRLKRNRGRRGLDVLAALQKLPKLDVLLYDDRDRDKSPMASDERLIDLGSELNGRVLTTDYNLNKVAQLRGIHVINVNDLARSMKPVVLPGEKMLVRIVKGGESAGQGVGYLDDGTMVVVEQARPHINNEVEFVVTSALQTSAGRMIFGKLSTDASPLPPPPGGKRQEAQPSQA